jgi:hypothetical protein
MGIELYSRLPNKIKNVEVLSTFKKELKSFLLMHSFYTVNEYYAVVTGQIKLSIAVIYTGRT